MRRALADCLRLGGGSCWPSRPCSSRWRVVVGVIALTALRGRLVTPVDQSSAGPVLLVPGYGGSAASLQGLATRLREAGRDVTVVDLPDRAQGDLTTQADALGATAAQVRARTRAPSVDVVGYSAGGVVARLWTTEGGGAGQVRRLVMLGSPLHGTDVARLGTLVSGTCPTACQQLAPDSAVLSRLDATALPPGVLGLSLWTHQRRGRPAAQLVGRGRRPQPVGAERLPGEHREPRRPADGPRRAEHRPRSPGNRARSLRSDPADCARLSS